MLTSDEDGEMRELEIDAITARETAQLDFLLRLQSVQYRYETDAEYLLFVRTLARVVSTQPENADLDDERVLRLVLQTLAAAELVDDKTIEAQASKLRQ